MTFPLAAALLLLLFAAIAACYARVFILRASRKLEAIEQLASNRKMK